MKACEKSLMMPNEKNSVGIGDLRSSLDAVKKANPQVEATIYSLNCFSGDIPYSLNDLPWLRSFASTTNTSEASSIPQAGSNNPEDFPRLFQSALATCKTYYQAFQRAQKQYFELSLAGDGSEIFDGPPRSQAQELIRKLDLVAA